MWSAKRIQALGYATLFSHVSNARSGVFYAIGRRIPRRLHPPAYLFFHLCYSLVTFAIAMACWRSFLLHTALLLAMVSVSIWHGANFYFEVFTRRNAAQLQSAAAAAKAGAASAAHQVDGGGAGGQNGGGQQQAAGRRKQE